MLSEMTPDVLVKWSSFWWLETIIHGEQYVHRGFGDLEFSL